MNIVQQPELAKRPTDYVILNCTISKIPWKYVKYYRWYMKDENDKEIHICINRLNHSDATDLNAHNCIFNHIFLNKVNESHYISSDSIHTAISIHVQLNDSYKYICETKLKNISRCDTEHGIKYKGGYHLNELVTSSQLMNCNYMIRVAKLVWCICSWPLFGEDGDDSLQVFKRADNRWLNL